MPSSPNYPGLRAERSPAPANPRSEQDEAHSDVFERPTIAPPFDLEAFAKMKMGQAEERVSRPDAPTMPPPRSGTHECSTVSLADLGEEALVARLGSLGRVATLRVLPGELRALAVDHRAAFLLAQIDGISTVEMILDVSGMARVDALRFLNGFVEQGIIALD